MIASSEQKSSQRKTLLFDCDGVLADTERHGHLPSFNQVFAEFGLPAHWSEKEYGRLLAIGGGKERLASLLTPEFIRKSGLPKEPQSCQTEIVRWHKRKTEIYTERVLAGKLPPRPGIARLIEEALEAGWRLAVASTSALPSVQAVLQVAAGDNAKRFCGIFAGDMVKLKKPAPDIYQLAMQRLEARSETTLVVEDSPGGYTAARAAGLNCIVTVNSYTQDAQFPQAALVVNHLGEPEQPMTILQNLSAARPVNHIRLCDLERCLTR